MATAPENRRTDSIRVRLAPEMMERLEALAARYGMPPSTLGAFAVAQFVQNEENKVSMARMAVLDATRRLSDEPFGSMDEATMERVFGPMLEALAKAQLPTSQPSLLLDGEAPQGGA